MINANSLIITESILVVGGWAEGDHIHPSRLDSVELLSPTPGTESIRLGRFPKKIICAVGTVLGELVIHIHSI